MKVKLGTLGEIFIGLTYKPEDVSNEGTIVLRSGNIQDGKLDFEDIVRVQSNIKDKLLVKDGDILMCSRNGSARLVGKTAIIKDLPESMTFGAFMTIIRTDKNSYLQYYFKSDYFRRQLKGSTTTTINQITRNMLINMEVPLLTESESVEIVNCLGRIENIIDMQRQKLQKLDELIKARFVELFGDRFVNDKKWETKKLGECMCFNNGKAHEQVVDENGDYILVTSRAVASELKDVRRTNALLFPLHSNDIVMVMSDVPNGRALAKCLLIDADNKYTLNQRICSFDNYEFDPIFLVNLLNRHQYFLGFNDGNGQTNLRKNDILECELIIPPMSLQEQFAIFVKQVDKSKFIKQKQYFTKEIHHNKYK